MLTYFALRLAEFLVKRLPERWGVAIARRLGALVYYVSPLAEASRDNFQHVLGPGAQETRSAELARHAFQYRALNYYHLLRLPELSAAAIERRVRVEGLEHIDPLVAQKQGAVIVSGHIGPMEVFIQAVSLLGYPLMGIVEHLEPERLHEYVTSLRTAHGLNLVSTRASLLDVYRRLKRGEFLLSMTDRDSTGTGLIVDFFGAPAWMPDGYARVAVRANVPVIYGFCRSGLEGEVARIYPPLFPNTCLEKEQAVLDLVQRTLRLQEEALRQYPHEWHLSTPIWQLGQAHLKKEGL
jgi:KDO2-lipid IV(A) lauroyltransferase